MPGTLPLQLGDLTLNFGVDVERRLALSLAALVAGDDELPDLLAQPRIDGRPGEAPDLRLDVHRGLAPAPAVLVAGGHELADLLVALGLRGGRGRRRLGARDLVAHREGATAD